MKTKLTLFVSVLVVALFGMGCSSLGKGLVAYYPFNGNAKDESGNGNDRLVKGATLTEDRNGETAGAYAFPDDTGTIAASMPEALAGEMPFTASLWFKINSDRNDM